MTKLEPTRTSSDLTATERLLRMLDERGVEYYASPNGIAWGKLATPIHWRMYTHYAVELDGLLCVDSHCITPEQAIAATLDDADLAAENAKLRELLKYNGAVIEACTSEILEHIGVPYIVGPAGVAQALMEATAMLVHKRYDFDPPSFYKVDE